MGKKFDIFILLLFGGSLAGCNPFGDDPAIATCEAILKGQLKSPSSYKRISADVLSNIVVIKYDAANSYNAILRDQKICEFHKDKNEKSARISDDKTNEYDECIEHVAQEKHLPSVSPAVELRKCGALAKESVLFGISIRKAVGENSYPIQLSATKLSFDKK